MEVFRSQKTKDIKQDSQIQLQYKTNVSLNIHKKRFAREVILNLEGNEIICRKKQPQMLIKTVKNLQNPTELERV